MLFVGYTLNSERKNKMKKTLNVTLCILLAVIICVCAASCAKETQTEELWANADYSVDCSFGIGSKTVYVEVKAGEKSVTFTLNTDAEILGDALVQHGLIDGEQGPYGLYVKKVNGIIADYDVNQSYWMFNKDGEYMMTGVDATEFADGEHYELVYTKQ